MEKRNFLKKQWEEGDKLSYKKKVDSGAYIVWALHKNQPQGFKELAKNSGVSESQLYRTLPQLWHKKIIEEIESHVFTLYDYQKPEEKVIEALKELIELFDHLNPPLRFIASHPNVRMQPEKVLKILYENTSINWRESSEEEVEDFEFKFKMMKEWAWQFKYELVNFELLPDGLKKRVKKFHTLYPTELRKPSTAIFRSR